MVRALPPPAVPSAALGKVGQASRGFACPTRKKDGFAVLLTPQAAGLNLSLPRAGMTSYCCIDALTIARSLSTIISISSLKLTFGCQLSF